MIFNRTWAMPHHNTFTVKPIGEFVKKYITGISVDPFSRDNDWCTHTNDLNPETKARYHFDAEVFLKKLHDDGVRADIVVFDPPYSPRQVSECYKSIGVPVGMKETQTAVLYKRIRDAVDLIIKPNGVVLSFGWNSVGMGIKRGYVLEEILLVCHGGAHNDTICLCERKVG